MPDRPTPRFSVVIPVHNEEADVRELCERVSAELDRLPGGYEVLFIDDGSTDATWLQLKALADPGRIRLIRFRRNYGKAAALMAGFAITRGELVFTMDGDLQDDPQEIPRFLEKMDGGFDLVSGWKKRRFDPMGKVIPSRIFNFVVRKATGLDLHDMNCGFKCYRGKLAREVRIYGELHRYIPALAHHEGYRVGEIEVQHHPRLHGKSKYGLSRLFKGFVDLGTVLLKTEYRTRPAHGFGWVALACAALGMLAGIGSVVAAGLTGYLTAGEYHHYTGVASILSAVSAGAANPFVWGLGLKSLFFWIAAVVVMAAGWIAEVAVQAPLEAAPASQYRIEESLD